MSRASVFFVYFSTVGRKTGTRNIEAVFRGKRLFEYSFGYFPLVILALARFPNPFLLTRDILLTQKAFVSSSPLHVWSRLFPFPPVSNKPVRSQYSIPLKIKRKYKKIFQCLIQNNQRIYFEQSKTRSGKKPGWLFHPNFRIY